MKTIITISAIFLLSLSGCQTTPPVAERELTHVRASGNYGILNFEPIIIKPTDTISLQINSIPSGADIYTIDPRDGMLGERIGTTPFLHEIKYASAKWRGYQGAIIPKTKAWGKGNRIYHCTDPQGYPYDLLYAEFMLVKEGVGIGLLKKQLFSTGEIHVGYSLGTHVIDSDTDPRSRGLNATVLLKTPEQLTAELEAKKQAIQVNQTISVQQKKDELDTANSFLDILIKLRGLGAL